MTKFKVGDKVRILNAKAIWLASSGGYSDGDVTKLVRTWAGGVGLTDKINGGNAISISAKEFQYIELVSDKPTKNQRIATLESEVAELKAKVEALEKAQKPSLVYEGSAQFINGERVIKVAPTYNEQRKAIIAEAKAFVEENLSKNHRGVRPCGLGVWLSDKYGYRITDRVEFVINAEKRTVVALIRDLGGKRAVLKAIAKCAPDDVFNADIGKAIALGRALGLDVSRFEQAVKPTEVVVGQRVKGNGDPHVYCVVPDFEDDDDVLSLAFCLSRKFSILDDTEAVY